MTPPFITQSITDLHVAQDKIVEAQTLISHVARALGLAGGGTIAPSIIERLDGASHDLGHAMDDIVAVRRGFIRTWDHQDEIAGG